MIKSSIELIDRLQNYNFKPTQNLVSFDVTSLFTNVPLEETIDIIGNTVYSPENKENLPPIRKSDFKQLLRLATEGMFLYKNKLYQQLNGVAMGSPLGLTLANFFLAYLETPLLQQKNDYSS